MTQIPILSGIYTDNNSDYRIKYPRNLKPVFMDQGISNGYLRPCEGILSDNDNAPGIGRGGISWNGVCYRVLGDKLCSVAADGAITELGTIPGSGFVTMDYSFDRLSITTDSRFFLYDGTSVTENTDPDLGVVFDHIWIDGYFMLTDGEFIIVTNLGDPFTIDPTKYGSSEVDPDPIKALIKVRDEAYVINRHTIEVFQNTGVAGFPFGRIDGAQIQKGAVGTHAVCEFLDSFAFVGSARNEAIGVYIADYGKAVKISDREIDLTLSDYSESILSSILCERKSAEGKEELYIHLPDQTLVYDAIESQRVRRPIWHTRTTSDAEDIGQYRANHLVWCYNKWLVSDPLQNRIGHFVNDKSDHWGDRISWDFSTNFIYNGSNGAIVHELELVALTGRAALGVDPQIWTEYSLDGFGAGAYRRYIKSGKIGDRFRRLVWLSLGPMETQRLQRFGGNSDSHASFSRLEARLEGLTA